MNNDIKWYKFDKDLDVIMWCIRHIHFFISLFIIGLMSAGCFLFGTKGIFDKNNYEIIKLEIDNRVLLSPQELANQARERLRGISHGNKYLQNNMLDSQFSLGYDTLRQNHNDNIDAAFEQLKQHNKQQDDDTENEVATSLDELAKITLKSTFNLDDTQDMLYGKVGCNNYTAKFFWQDSTKIVISGGASTRKLCYPKEVGNFQNEFVRNLDGIYTITKLKNRKGYVLNNGRMRIYLK